MEKYNGFSNRATWSFSLWLDNEQGTQELMRELCQKMNAYELMEYCKEEMFEPESEKLDGMYQDLFMDLIDLIDWKEVREHFQAE